VNAEVDGKISVIFDGVFAGWDENRERSELSFWLFSFDLSLLILFAFWARWVPAIAQFLGWANGLWAVG
jgi:hypothetical protein